MVYHIRSIQIQPLTFDESCVSYEDIFSPSKKGRLHLRAAVEETSKHSHDFPIELMPSEWFIVHQTGILPLKEPSKTWRESWSEQAFTTTLQGDDENRNDMIRLSEKLNTTKHLDTYDDLPVNIQRVDMWRYAKLFLDGGIYADIDISATVCT
jgi:mannosyltransferase OCH1-like enzyme